MARMTLNDFDAELIARGFDAFSQPTRYRYINWGYRRIARRARWLWEQTTATDTLDPGEFYVGAWDELGDVSHPIANMKSITKVYIVSPADLRGKVRPLSDDEFFENWLPLDLTNTQNRSTPSAYYWFEDRLHILPPPDRSINVVVHYKQQVLDLVNGTDVPITPPDLDEGIITAALIRCHKRATEISLANQSQGELDEIFGDMATDESFLHEEQPLRVSPDDSWL